MRDHRTQPETLWGQPCGKVRARTKRRERESERNGTVDRGETIAREASSVTEIPEETAAEEREEKGIRAEPDNSDHLGGGPAGYIRTAI